MENKPLSNSPTSAGAVVGALLVLAGVMFLVSRYVPFDLAQFGWPLFIVLPGVALIAVAVSSRAVVGLAVPGAIATVVGLILAVQNTFGLWAAWSYAWALVFPGAVGLGVLIMGLVRGDRFEARRGRGLIVTGLTMFLVFAMFFEGLLHVSGVDFGPVAAIVLPVCIIAVGLAFLVASFGRRTPA